MDLYASDCTDGEWRFIVAFMPSPSRSGRPRRSNLREVWDAIQYIATTGYQWALPPKCFALFTTVQYYFYQLRDNETLDLLNESRIANDPDHNGLGYAGL